MLRNFIFSTNKTLRKLGIDISDGKHPAVSEMQKSIMQSGGITFKYELYPDGSWTAESTNFDGIITGERSTKKINSIVKDAIFTYFGVPAQHCNDELLVAPNEPISIRQRVFATK
jgi:hypothetical protein